ncbi:hypothetical protein Anapl_02463 [Anas platyrhynchos]|uniref:Uncharacterized protein n=1 Tax=Anas platyrhynchos TaxID=8839 RepID=R0LT89_ANAPL|nr:hypothetical protein Anapl_02463 [Anas platyrhynchos]
MEDLVRERQNQLLSFKAITNGFVARLHLHKTGYQEERAALQNEPAGRGAWMAAASPSSGSDDCGTEWSWLHQTPHLRAAFEEGFQQAPGGGNRPLSKANKGSRSSAPNPLVAGRFSAVALGTGCCGAPRDVEHLGNDPKVALGGMRPLGLAHTASRSALLGDGPAGSVLAFAGANGSASGRQKSHLGLAGDELPAPARARSRSGKRSESCPNIVYTCAAEPGCALLLSALIGNLFRMPQLPAHLGLINVHNTPAAPEEHSARVSEAQQRSNEGRSKSGLRLGLGPKGSGGDGERETRPWSGALK